MADKNILDVMAQKNRVEISSDDRSFGVVMFFPDASGKVREYTEDKSNYVASGAEIVREGFIDGVGYFMYYHQKIEKSGALK